MRKHMGSGKGQLETVKGIGAHNCPDKFCIVLARVPNVLAMEMNLHMKWWEVQRKAKKALQVLDISHNWKSSTTMSFSGFEDMP